MPDFVAYLTLDNNYHRYYQLTSLRSDSYPLLGEMVSELNVAVSLDLVAVCRGW